MATIFAANNNFKTTIFNQLKKRDEEEQLYKNIIAASKVKK